MNTFTEEKLREEFDKEFGSVELDGIKLSRSTTGTMMCDFFLDKFKAYQSHLISEGEKMKRQTDEDTNGYCITCGGYIFGNECTCDIYTKAITSYQAIIRDEK